MRKDGDFPASYVSLPEGIWSLYTDSTFEAEDLWKLESLVYLDVYMLYNVAGTQKETIVVYM